MEAIRRKRRVKNSRTHNVATTARILKSIWPGTRITGSNSSLAPGICVASRRRDGYGCRATERQGIVTIQDKIERSLELVAERGDPAPSVYARLFADYPEMEALFVRDTTGAIRGNMLAEVITAVLDFAGANHYGANLMRAEIVNHEHLGVPPAKFSAFFTKTRDVFAKILGDEWTPAIDAAWREILARIDHSLR